MYNWQTETPKELGKSYWFKDASSGKLTAVTIIQHYDFLIALGENIYAPLEKLTGQWLLIPKPE
jgi:hypothetical protein